MADDIVITSLDSEHNVPLEGIDLTHVPDDDPSKRNHISRVAEERTELI